ncbi:Phosphoesterase [Penicillium chermesinum]|nr:Phosphoesterase [Penicillium chermesinum]
MFSKQTLSALVGAVALASARTIPASDKLPSAEEIAKAQATVVPYSPVSNVKGLAFDRFAQIWIENTDYQTTANNIDFATLAKEGILLTNYFATTHPSQPNYLASAAGDNFGLDNDDFQQQPANISRGPAYAGYQGYLYPETGPHEYVRKHDPLILLNSVTDDDTRPRQIKNFSTFYEDLEHERIPQYMFITPNMTNDAHDSDINVAGSWLADFLPPLLKNEYFSKDTLILVTFDETGNYTEANRVYSFLVGGAVPQHLKGTWDDTFYTHYSIIASLSANWGLPSLGRWDCGANLLKLVAEKTGFVNWQVDYDQLYLNETYPGPQSEGEYSEELDRWPVPTTSEKCTAGHGIVDIVKKTYEGREPTYNYTSPIPYDSVSGTNTGIKYWRTLQNGKKETGITL